MQNAPNIAWDMPAQSDEISPTHIANSSSTTRTKEIMISERGASLDRGVYTLSKGF